MGVAISTHTSTSPLTLVSTIIGFVSFAFTLGTFFKVVWVNLMTMGEAPHEVHAFLTNLRTELLEERANLRKMKKGMKRFRRMNRKYEMTIGPELDDVGWKTMNDTLKYCIKRFRELEKPFLEPGEHGIADASNRRRAARRRHSSVSPPRYSHAAYSSPPEKSEHEARDRSRARPDESWDREDEDEAFWAQRTHYARFTIRKRFQWLTRKSQAQALVSELTRLQLRRVARQVTGITISLHEYGCETLELNETVRRIDDRVSRVVGVRRISE